MRSAHALDRAPPAPPPRPRYFAHAGHRRSTPQTTTVPNRSGSLPALDALRTLRFEIPKAPPHIRGGVDSLPPRTDGKRVRCDILLTGPQSFRLIPLPPPERAISMAFWTVATASSKRPASAHAAANHPDPESCGTCRKDRREASTGADAGEVLSREIRQSGSPTLLRSMSPAKLSKSAAVPGRVEPHFFQDSMDKTPWGSE